MAIASTTLKERRRKSDELIAKLVGERTEMLVLFCRVAGLEPYSEKSVRGDVQKLLQQFCQILIDYMASGHFLLYERIAAGAERRTAVSALAAAAYPRIATTTQAALDFNDKYDCEDHCENLDGLTLDLSRLGEELAARIELEDQLLRALR